MKKFRIYIFVATAGIVFCLWNFPISSPISLASSPDQSKGTSSIVINSYSGKKSELSQNKTIVEFFLPSLLGIGMLINLFGLILIYQELSKILNYLDLPKFLDKFKRRVPQAYHQSNKKEISFEEDIKTIISEELISLDLPLIKQKLDNILNDLGVPRNNEKSMIDNLTNYSQKNKQEQKVTTNETLFQIIEQLAIIKELINTTKLDEKELYKFIQLSQKAQVQVREEQGSSIAIEPHNNTLEASSSNMSSQLIELIREFNSQNRQPFYAPYFQPLNLTQKSIQGQVGLNARRIVQLEEPVDSSQSSYLRFEMDKENWLIPNITSPYISQIMRNLSENSDIFIVHSGSGALQLVRPAKLKSSILGIWEIKEPGEFTQR